SRRGVLLPALTLRLRKANTPAQHHWPDPAELRECPIPESAVFGRKPLYDDCLPNLCAVSVAHGGTERRAGTQGKGDTGGRAPPPRARADRYGRARRVRVCISARAFRRHAPEGRVCARHGGRA